MLRNKTIGAGYIEKRDERKQEKQAPDDADDAGPFSWFLTPQRLFTTSIPCGIGGELPGPCLLYTHARA